MSAEEHITGVMNSLQPLVLRGDSAEALHLISVTLGSGITWSRPAQAIFKEVTSRVLVYATQHGQLSSEAFLALLGALLGTDDQVSLSLTCKDCEAALMPSGNSVKCRAIVDYAKIHCTERERTRLVPLAKEFGLTPAHLCRLVRQHSGQGINDHVRQARAEQAAHLLASRGLPLKQIAAKLGYSSVSQFCRDFRKVFATTPRRFTTMSQSVGPVPAISKEVAPPG
jgi:AraC-like DNA-binding protein